MKRLTKDEKETLIKQYASGKHTCISLAKQYGISNVAISGLLKRHGISVNNNQSTLQRKYPLNEHYFDIIDTEAKAYFLGLLYADGYNHETRGNIALTLQEKDTDILDTFSSELETTRPLQFIQRNNPKWKDCYRLAISSKWMSTKLKQCGCHQKKSFTLQFPNTKIVPEHLLKHFIRGYFDGDGSLIMYQAMGKYKGIPKYPYTVVKVGIVSTLGFTKQLQSVIEKYLGITSYISIRHKNRTNTTRQLTINGKQQVLKFLNWLYQEATIYFERKHSKYNTLFSDGYFACSIGEASPETIKKYIQTQG